MYQLCTKYRSVFHRRARHLYVDCEWLRMFKGSSHDGPRIHYSTASSRVVGLKNLGRRLVNLPTLDFHVSGSERR